MKKDVMLVTGAGQISMAIARRVGFGKWTAAAVAKYHSSNDTFGHAGIRTGK